MLELVYIIVLLSFKVIDCRVVAVRGARFLVVWSVPPSDFHVLRQRTEVEVIVGAMSRESTKTSRYFTGGTTLAK